MGETERVKTPFAHFPSKSMVYSDPYGLVLIISPWNYPFQLTLHPLIAAIAAGNTVVIKPSEISQYSTNILIEIVEEIYPEEFVAVVEGEKEETRELLESDFDYIFYREYCCGKDRL